MKHFQWRFLQRCHRKASLFQDSAKVLLVLKPILKLALFFPQIALAIGVLTSSLGVGDRDISRVVRGGCHRRCCQGWHWWCSIADLGGRCCAGRWLGMFLVGCELGCCWWCVNGMWLGYGVISWCCGFTHLQPNSIRLRKTKIPFHAIWGLCWYNSPVLTSSKRVRVRRFFGFVLYFAS